LDCTPDLVAPFSPLAELRLAEVAGVHFVQRVRACELGAIDTIFGSTLERIFVKAGRGKTAHPV
jgi:hypothetical protein